MEPLFILVVKPPQVSSLDPQKYDVVILVVVLVVSDDKSPIIFSGTLGDPTHMHPQPPPQSIFCLCCRFRICQMLGVNQQTFSYCRTDPALAIAVG